MIMINTPMTSNGSERLPPSLEDYIETIYEISRDRKFARVRDIVKRRGVKSSSVTGALKKLEERGLIEYEKREYIALTPKGEEEARKVLSRHDILTQFFTSVLQMQKERAEHEACVIEHYLSDNTRDRLVRFIEYIDGAGSLDASKFQEGFRQYLQSGLESSTPLEGSPDLKKESDETPTLADLSPGQSGTVVRIAPGGAVRKRLLDMGILPNVKITMERSAVGGDPLWISVRGYQLSLRRKEASLIQIVFD